MRQGIRSTCALLCALLLVLPALTQARDSRTDRIAPEPVPPQLGPRAVPTPGPLPLDGTTGPGDDDMPNLGGPGGVGNPSRDTINAASGGKFLNPRDWAAWIRRHVLEFIRAPR